MSLHRAPRGPGRSLRSDIFGPVKRITADSYLPILKWGSAHRSSHQFVGNCARKLSGVKK